MRHRILGIAFLVAIAMFVSLTVAIYRDAFGDYVKVTLKTDHIGNQLQTASDVKVRGLIVGSVKAVRTKGDGAELELALLPDKVDQIPANVSARLLPKTLFGERYVNLVLPPQKAGKIRGGDTIQQDKSSSAIELERVLDDLMPVLQSIQPEKLATTLTALSQALDGRGKPLGTTLVSLDQYLGELNPQLPLLKQNISKLADVANVYSDAAPDLINALNDMTVTSKTLVEQQQNLLTLYGTMTTTSQDLTSFLTVNKNNLIQLNKTSRPTLELLGKYAPEYPCLLKQLAEFEPLISKAFGEGTNEPGLHITLEITQNRGKYLPNKDEPEYKDKRGPRCYDITPRPDPFPQYPPDGPVQDGSSAPPPARVAQDGILPPATAQGFTGTSAVQGAPSIANSPEEMALIAALFGPQVGVEYQQMPSWSALLLGPLARGTEVTVK
ncbi:ABC transporter substrate-binding protein [Lentzea sp. NBRC 105346]|uniref:MCE family protein n=1 Tax=Lentzea sp. NBRC 105346 TaxID=3032205 RepID=UPI002557662E|nr:MCE family protein [Lentzea sp. NBRC 105346]GLZ30551.1 ABC transporter substrate-binding protein [Lentzea sp. NBRC 105346]